MPFSFPSAGADLSQLLAYYFTWQTNTDNTLGASRVSLQGEGSGEQGGREDRGWGVVRDLKAWPRGMVDELVTFWSMNGAVCGQATVEPQDRHG